MRLMNSSRSFTHIDSKIRAHFSTIIHSRATYILRATISEHSCVAKCWFLVGIIGNSLQPAVTLSQACLYLRLAHLLSVVDTIWPPSWKVNSAVPAQYFFICFQICVLCVTCHVPIVGFLWNPHFILGRSQGCTNRQQPQYTRSVKSVAKCKLGFRSPQMQGCVECLTPSVSKERSSFPLKERAVQDEPCNFSENLCLQQRR